MSKQSNKREFAVKAAVLAITCFLVIAGGITGMNRLAASKKPPAKKEAIQKKLAVSTIPADKEAVSLSVTGYGQAEPVNVAEISPEVSGKIIEKHPSLDLGGTIQKGEVLFKIDATDYESEALKAGIQVKLQENQIEQLTISYERDKGRLKTIQKNTRLSKSEYLRLNKLYKNDRVGTLSAVETAEQSYNSLLDSEKTLKKSIALYPLQIAEARSNLADARADLETARLNVKRCVVTAPFTGRVKEASVETGSYVTTGTPALTLADDRLLEIQVALSDKDAFEVLGLRTSPGDAALFSGLDEIDCRVKSVTGNVSADLPARLDRAVKYDADARTLYLAARVSLDDPRRTSASVPLMDGMFCKVFLQGKSVREAVKIPASAFNSDRTVYLSRDGKLTTLPVDKVMEDGDMIYISGDFQPRDRIITTQLSNPIENTQLEISGADENRHSLAVADHPGESS